MSERLEKESAGSGELSASCLDALLEKDRLAYLGALIQGFVHNANGPLQNLSMLSEVLLKNEESLDGFVRAHCSCGPMEEWESLIARQRSRFQQLGQQIGLLAEMLRDFMDIHDIERNSREVDVNFLLAKLTAVFRADLFFKHRLTIDLDLAGNLPLARIPGGNLVPALVHVLRNAITAMRDSPEKRLGILSRREGDRILIEVKDTGCGFEDEEELFAPLRSAWPATEPGIFGTEKHIGFGLYATRHLLGAYGGSIDVSRRGKETVSALRVPARV